MRASGVLRVPVRIYVVRGLRLETVRGPLRWVLALMERITSFCATHILYVSRSLREISRRWGWVHEGRACFSSRARRGESRSLALPGPPSESRQAGLYAPGSGYPWTPGWQGSWGG